MDEIDASAVCGFHPAGSRSAEIAADCADGLVTSQRRTDSAPTRQPVDATSNTGPDQPEQVAPALSRRVIVNPRKERDSGATKRV